MMMPLWLPHVLFPSLCRLTSLNHQISNLLGSYEERLRLAHQLLETYKEVPNLPCNCTPTICLLEHSENWAFKQAAKTKMLQIKTTVQIITNLYPESVSANIPMLFDAAHLDFWNRVWTISVHYWSISEAKTWKIILKQVRSQVKRRCS